MNLLLNNYFNIREKVFEYFGYVEGWEAMTIRDSREEYWRLIGEGPGTVISSEESKAFDDPEGDYYEVEIYARHHTKWVYRGKDFTMICTDPHVNGNHFLSIFDNSKEFK